MAQRVSSIPSPPGSRPKLVVCHAHSVATTLPDASAVARAILSGALLAAMAQVGANRADAASWCGVDVKTLRRWLNDSDSRGVDVRAVLNSPVLRTPFARALVELLNKTESGRTR